jgi:hemerythrin-like metal-binding protein
MSLVRWSDRFNLNVAVIDAAHRYLFEILDRLHAELLGARSRQVIDQLLAELVDYTKTHFAEEEALMLAWHEPDIERHRAAHRGLEKRLAEIDAEWRRGDVRASIDFFGFLFGDWLWRHIMETDMKINKVAV